MNLTRLVPEPNAVVDVDTEQGRAMLADYYAVPRKPWLRINLISSVNGSASGCDGTSESLTSRVDRRILGTIRRAADAVLVGAQSVRTEGYLLPKMATLAIVTVSGELRGHRIPADVDAGRVMVLCPTGVRHRVLESLGSSRASIVEIGSRAHPKPLEAREVIRALSQRGLDSLVCEGGPSLASQLLGAGLVDELCLTTSPLLSPTELPLLAGLENEHRLTLEQLLKDDEGALYARWRVST